MRLIFTLFLSVLFAFPASAETISASSLDPVFCGLLTRHVPGDDVEYKGDSDIPADIGAQTFAIPGDVVIPLSVELSEYFGIDTGEGVEMKPEMGVFRIKSDGRVFWNERELTAQARDYCSPGLTEALPAEAILSEEPTAPAQTQPQTPPQPQE